MTLCEHALDDVRQVVYVAFPVAVEEECCVDAGIGEDVEDVLRVDVGAVVEGECDCVWDGAVVEDDAVG